MIDEKKVRTKYPLLTSTPKEKEDWLRAASTDFKDTPKSLYRFLYMWEPKYIDFSDMYKSTLAIIDLDGKGLVYLDLYKYELAAYFYVPPEELKPKPEQVIEMSCGVQEQRMRSLSKAQKPRGSLKHSLNFLSRSLTFTQGIISGFSGMRP